MKRFSVYGVSLVVIFAVWMLVGGSSATAQECTTPNWTVFATGLTNPRHIRFGPDGDLYVAEAGIGGDLSPTCETPKNIFTQDGLLPYKGGYTARISRIRLDGTRETVASGLPSFYDQVTSDALG